MTQILFVNDHLNWLEQQLRKENFSYKKIKADLYETPLKEDEGITAYNDIYAIKQSDYNKLAASLQMKQLFMKDNEAYVLTGSAYVTLFSEFEPSYNRKSITLSSTNTQLQVKGYEQVGAIPSNFSYQTLILPDAVVNNLPNTTKHVTAYNYNVQNWEKTYEIADDFMKKIQRDRQKFQYEGPLIRSYESAGSLYRITSGSAAYFLIGTFLGVIFFYWSRERSLLPNVYRFNERTRKVCSNFKNWGNRCRDEKDLQPFNLAFYFSFRTLWRPFIQCSQQKCFKT